MVGNDSKENELFELYPEVLNILLFDFTTEKNIVWATDNYRKKGVGYSEKDYIMPALITGKHSNVIKPRVEKSKAEQLRRSKDSAEVFTPSWMCNKQNNLVDNAWFGYENVFNQEIENSWVSKEKVDFKNNKNWKDYVLDVRLEITCGEAPYVVSRYDTVTGQMIDLENRIGLLDRKLRVVNENANSDEEWLEYAIKSLQSVYGFEYQGDSLLIARENVFFSFIDYYEKRFDKCPKKDMLVQIATIISWNFWQMDGIKLVIPFTCHEEEPVQLSLFEEAKSEFCKGCRNGNPKDHNGKRSLIMDWVKNKKVRFVDILWS